MSAPAPRRAPRLAPVRTRTLRVPEPFELRLVLFGHGWIELAPHVWDPITRTWRTAIHIEGRAHAITIRQHGGQVQIRAKAADGGAAEDPRPAVARMLRLELDLEPFWAICDQDPRLAWSRQRGAGRLLRSAHAFEDLMKLLFTTNCSWSATKLMTRRLVDTLGVETADGMRAFPTAEHCAAKDEAFWRNVVHTGYRAKAATLLSRAFAAGTLSDEHFTDPSLAADVVRTRLLALEGFGPYAAGQALRLFGHHEDLALDSWCRATWTKLRAKNRPPADATIAREYRHFGKWQGLGLWLDLTAQWHVSED